MKKRFGLFDVYQNIVTNEQSQIEGIEEYNCQYAAWANSYTINVVFTNPDEQGTRIYYEYCPSIERVRNAIKEINKQLRWRNSNVKSSRKS